MNKTALIDGDLFLYRIGFGKQDEPLQGAIEALEQSLYGILEAVHADTFKVYLSCPLQDNFRYKIYPEYKAGRKEKPDHYQGLKDHLITAWNAEVCDGIEADDALSLNYTDEDVEECVIVSIDKDLLQVPGNHYNFVKQEHVTVSRFQATYNYYFQVLMGDSTDNIKGCPGIGKVKAAKALDSCVCEKEMFDIVRTLYYNDYTLLLNAQLVWLLSKDRTNLIMENLNGKESTAD